MVAEYISLFGRHELIGQYGFVASSNAPCRKLRLNSHSTYKPRSKTEAIEMRTILMSSIHERV